MIGEIGGNAEEDAAASSQKHVQEAGRRLHRRADGAAGRRMGHAGAIIAGRQGHGGREDGGAHAAGVHVVKSPADIGAAVKDALRP